MKPIADSASSSTPATGSASLSSRIAEGCCATGVITSSMPLMSAFPTASPRAATTLSRCSKGLPLDTRTSLISARKFCYLSLFTPTFDTEPFFMLMLLAIHASKPGISQKKIIRTHSARRGSDDSRLVEHNPENPNPGTIPQKSSDGKAVHASGFHISDL